MPKKYPKLREKLFNVMKSVPEMIKTGSMEENGSKSYSYHEIEEIRGRFHAALLKNRLLCFPTNVQAEHWANPTHSGGLYNYSQQHVTFTFFDVDSDATISFESVGWGSDVLEKCSPKAMSQSFKYGFINCFHVRGIEVDGDSSDQQIEGREANKQHQWFEGLVDCYHAEKDYAWIMMDGQRFFAKDKKIMRALKKACAPRVGHLSSSIRSRSPMESRWVPKA